MNMIRPLISFMIFTIPLCVFFLFLTMPFVNGGPDWHEESAYSAYIQVRLTVITAVGAGILAVIVFLFLPVLLYNKRRPLLREVCAYFYAIPQLWLGSHCLVTFFRGWLYYGEPAIQWISFFVLGLFFIILAVFYWRWGTKNQSEIVAEVHSFVGQ